MNAVAQALILSAPLIFSGAVHMAVVKLDLFSMLRVPIHKQSFGANKTWRGVLVMPLAAAFGVRVTSGLWPEQFAGWNSLYLGCLLGLAYAIAELPNSFIKRRLGIEPGKRPPRYTAWFTFADQADSAIACALVYGLALQLRPSMVLMLAAIGPAIHLIVNYSLYLMGLRKEPV